MIFSSLYFYSVSVPAWPMFVDGKSLRCRYAERNP